MLRPLVDVDYRRLLQEELAARRGRNPVYSARALARDIGVSPGFLSQVMARKKAINEERAFKIAVRLGWDRRKSRQFTTLVRYESARDPGVRESILGELNRQGKGEILFHDLSLDTFKAISEWYHYAILELTMVEGFAPEPAWIARKLGIPAGEARAALARLSRLGLLEIAPGRMKKSKANYSILGIPSAAIRGFHAQMLQKAATALESQDVEQRDFSGVTMAIDPAKLPQARKRLTKFRRELMEFLESGRRKAVYHLSLQLFRLDLGENHD